MGTLLGSVGVPSSCGPDHRAPPSGGWPLIATVPHGGEAREDRRVAGLLGLAFAARPRHRARALARSCVISNFGLSAGASVAGRDGEPASAKGQGLRASAFFSKRASLLTATCQLHNVAYDTDRSAPDGPSDLAPGENDVRRRRSTPLKGTDPFFAHVQAERAEICYCSLNQEPEDMESNQ